VQRWPRRALLQAKATGKSSDVLGLSFLYPVPQDIHKRDFLRPVGQALQDFVLFVLLVASSPDDQDAVQTLLVRAASSHIIRKLNSCCALTIMVQASVNKNENSFVTLVGGAVQRQSITDDEFAVAHR